MMKYRKIFFDLDGTLSDSYKGIENGLRFALKETGIDDIPEKELKKMIGIPLQESLKKYYDSADDINKSVACFRKYYAEQGLKESELYPGIITMLEELATITDIYVVTAKPSVYASKLLQHHKVEQFFTGVFGCAMDGGAFCKSELIKNVNNIEYSIMVGDKPQDITAGKKAGIATAGVLYGYGTKEEINESEPDFILNSVSELRALLQTPK